MKGKLIVIDGTDGSGKATQTKILVHKLKKHGFKTATLDFPQYYANFFGNLVGRYLKGEFGNLNQVSPYLASVIYALDRWESKEKILNWLKRGYTVILDRYVSANQIHQGAKIQDAAERKKFLQWLEKMEFGIFELPRPDLVLYLYVPPKISQKLVDKKHKRGYLGDSKRDIQEKNLKHLTLATKQCLRLIKSKNNWIKINCIQNEKILTPEIISQKVWQTLINNKII